MNPFTHVVSSLANAILDLGLPTIRGWLRERLGDAADVANVTTDGSVVSLEDVRIPIGPRGLVVLTRAAATITSLGEAGPALRLHSFEGVLVFGPVDAPAFRAQIAFRAGDDPDDDAWIWGDVAIRNATWTSTGDADPPRALHGAARLFVSSKTWRVEGGRLDGGPSTGNDAKPPVVAHFAAAGSLETGAPPVATAVLALEHARVGPFLDAASALIGTFVQMPAFVPRAMTLDGELSWSSESGARVEVTRLGASGVLAHASASCAADGSALDGRLEGNLGLTAFLFGRGIPEAALPRVEDTLKVAVDLGGTIRAPELRIEARVPSLGFRFGRARFVPAACLRDGVAKLTFANGQLAGTAQLFAGASPVNATVAGTRVEVHAAAIEAAFLREVARVFDAKLTVADDVHAEVALVFDGAALGGTVTLASARSRLVAQLGTPIRVTGGLTAEDIVATGALANAAVFPSDGDVVVALDVTTAPAFAARGSLAAAGKLELTVNHRADMPPYIVEGAHANVSADANGFAFENLRFTGYGGRFAGYGGSAAPHLVLQLASGGLPLADALFLLAPPRTRPALRFPEDVRWTGTLTLGADLAIDANLLTGKGTNLDVAVRLRHGDLAGSTAKGALAVADLLFVTSWDVPVAPEGLVVGDADIAAGLVYRIAASSARLRVPPLTLDDVAASVVIAHGDVLWNRAEARLADGRLSSFGMSRKSGELTARVSAAAVAMHELPAIEGKTPSAYVRGRASGSVMLHKHPGADLEARGDVVLDEAAFPVIDRARPALERYGLRPPNEDATGPAVLTIAVDRGGVHASDISVSLHGASVRGRVGMTNDRALDGKIEIVLEEEYLRTSKMLTLPRVLGERLVIPVRIGGTTQKADVHAELGQTLGRFLRESKVGGLVASAVEEAQLLFRPSKVPPPPPEEPTRASQLPDWETPLRAAVDAHATDWATLATRRG